jgi:hypothetical protein
LDKRNILVIAGYDVLADKSPDHRKYVKESFWRGTADEVDLIFVVGGATNPDYPNLTEAEANFTILEEEFIGYDKISISIEVLPFGNTSAETLQAVKEHLEREKISVNKLILSAEQSRIAGFLLDALMVGLNDCSDYIIAHGYPFLDSKKNFESQRKKMLMKILSHYGFPFNILRRVYQWVHQRRVAWIKRKQAKALRKS